MTIYVNTYCIHKKGNSKKTERGFLKVLNASNNERLKNVTFHISFPEIAIKGKKKKKRLTNFYPRKEKNKISSTLRGSRQTDIDQMGSFVLKSLPEGLACLCINPTLSKPKKRVSSFKASLGSRAKLSQQ